MSDSRQVDIRFDNHVIDHADERAAFFFISNLSSVRSNSYDRWIADPENPADRFIEKDVQVINATMMARTGYRHWEEFTSSAVPLPWLQALDPSWNLFSMDDDAWEAAECEPRIRDALTGIMAQYRTTSISTKILHAKRSHLIPICDSYVCAMVGMSAGNAGKTTKLIMRVRDIGRANLDALTEISERLKGIGIERSLVRILDALLWSGYLENGPDKEFMRVLTSYRGGRLFFQR